MATSREITITFTVPELDFVCTKLADLPFKEVSGLIAKIVNQANATASFPPLDQTESTEQKSEGVH